MAVEAAGDHLCRISGIESPEHSSIEEVVHHGIGTDVPGGRREEESLEFFRPLILKAERNGIAEVVVEVLRILIDQCPELISLDLFQEFPVSENLLNRCLTVIAASGDEKRECRHQRNAERQDSRGNH